MYVYLKTVEVSPPTLASVYSLFQAEGDYSGSSESRQSDDYILISKEGEASGCNAGLEPSQKEPLQKHIGPSDMKPETPSNPLTFTDPLMGGHLSSGNLSSSPDDDSSNNSKDSDFTIVSPLDI